MNKHILRLLGLTAFVGAVVLATAALLPGQARAHGGEIKTAGGARGPVSLSPNQAKAIQLELATADFRPFEDTLDLNAQLAVLPNAQADVSLRISGQVTDVSANLGDHVTKGQRLAVVQSRLVGNPPPSTVVTAPLSGVVDRRQVNLGQPVEPDTVLFHISDRRRMLVVAQLYEEDLGKVAVGQTARVHPLAYPDKTFSGKVTLVSPNLDPETRTVSVWIEVDNPKDLLRPDMFATASVVLKRDEGALTVSNTAILEANGEKFVFVKEGDKFHRVEITTGSSNDVYTVVNDGLVPGDQVATQGNREIYTLWLTGGQTEAKE